MGVEIQIKKEGKGNMPPVGSEVTVHYVGTLGNGTVFDSSRKRGVPFVFKLGAGKVIKGWDEGVAKMRVGETSILTITPDYGYGARTVGPIPGNSTLIFEVELITFTHKQ
ncbi:hypothetical protein RB653_002204 [Dictyostelium firmibasis]|uniref:peptidylprolyl isomerase n=1 Tax=Dictyostelium firmibasis TaxID=79012 RepID=A0AAN7U8A2_9MYCE